MVNWAANYLEEYSAVTEAQTNFGNNMQRIITSAPPPQNLFKINVDGTVAIANKKAGVGVIVRDELGRMEATMCRNLNAPLCAIEAKSKAVEVGLLFTQDIGIQDIVVESDSLITVQALNGNLLHHPQSWQLYKALWISVRASVGWKFLTLRDNVIGRLTY